jgi:drug/metabolite transporter (DMT)-like permease
VLLNLENGLHANPIGAIVLLIAPMSWALGSILSQHLPSPKGLMASASQMLAGGVMLFIAEFTHLERDERPIGTCEPVAENWLESFAVLGWLIPRGNGRSVVS